MHLLKSILLSILSVVSVAHAADITCIFKGTPDYIKPPVLKKTCVDADTSQETCTQFEIRGQQDKFKWIYQSNKAKLPMTGNLLRFKPYDIKYVDEAIAGNSYTRWLVAMIDNSGSASRAEERFLVLEDGTGKTLSKLMTYVEYEKFKIAKRSDPASSWTENTMASQCK